MSDFLYITTVFNNSNERNINFLRSLYSDYVRLSEIMKSSLLDKTENISVKNKKILLKPNWVKHTRRNTDELCLRTHDNFTLAVLKIILESGAEEVLIADAPIQGCVWDRMISESFINKTKELSDQYKVTVRIKDFRRRTYNFAANNPMSEINPICDYVIFDLGNESYLESVTESGLSKFRVTNYDPDRMSAAHSPGMHKYCIARDFFEADIVISLPKIKTHQKTGITGALKNIVGINGDKDFLPHHRIGGTKMGGDCYPGRSYLRYWSELLLDNANRRQGSKSFFFMQKLSSLIWRLSFPGPIYNMAAGWYGNDTTWRMVMDLNKIAEYGNEYGTICVNPQRRIFSLCDGVIAGQGDGPLSPEPLPLGIISFTDNSYINDRAMALLMDLPIEKIPLLNSNSVNDEPVCEIIFNGTKVLIDYLKQYSVKTALPKGWAEYFSRIV